MKDESTRGLVDFFFGERLFEKIEAGFGEGGGAFFLVKNPIDTGIRQIYNPKNKPTVGL